MKVIAAILFVLISTSCTNNVESQPFEINSESKISTEFIAKVIGVKDGDTIEILYKKKNIVVRFEHIDCPEKKQPFGKKAKQFVSDEIFSKDVQIVSNGKTDRWGRLIATVLLENGENLNKLLVLNGLAMHYKKYSNDGSYDILENQARRNKVGIWSDPNTITPWDYRKRKKNQNAQ